VKAKQSLSEADKRFVERIVSGESPTATDALRQTRTVTGNRSSANHAASVLWRSPLAQEYAEALRQKMLAKRQRRIAGEQDAVRRRLWIEATPIGDRVTEVLGVNGKPVLGQGAKASDRVAALRLIGQASAMFADKLVVEEPDKSRAEMLAEIQTLLGVKPTEASPNTSPNTDPTDPPESDTLH